MEKPRALNEDIVISGISGRFPESDTVEEFKENLYGGVDMITEDNRRWKPGMFETPKGMGKLKNPEYFDHLFFEVHGRQANSMDPAERILLEVVYEAIFDSGYSPFSFAGKLIGVFAASPEVTYAAEYVRDELNDMYNCSGNVVALFANRISFAFNFQGPSMTIDTGCASSLTALDEAILSLQSGRCEAAVVVGSRLSFKLLETQWLNVIQVLSPDSRSKPFDNSANGFARAEAVCAVFLQKASDARRCYATALYCLSNNDGKKQQGINFPSSEGQIRLFKNVYSQLGISPSTLAYLEAHGTGTKVGDPQEGLAITEVFCVGRKTPLLVGSVKSNAGHSEGSSGLMSLTKVILAMEEGLIPANLHYKEPNSKVPALREGLLKVVTEHTPFPGGIVAINNYGWGGCNSHFVLRSHDSKKYEPATKRKIPRLVLACGRTEPAVSHIFETVQKKQFNDDALALLEEAAKVSPERMRFRGYSLLENANRQTGSSNIQEFKGELRPVWFLYSGMGSQWSGMARTMMEFEPFASSVKASAEILRPLGVDLLFLLTQATDDDFNHIVVPFVTIAAVQIALTEMLLSMGVKPDGVVGHSVGELGCSFADGSLTAKQMLLAAYWRGKSCEMAGLIHGKMAAIGMTWEESCRRCPEGVFTVCHNSENSVTISGPSAQVQTYVSQLQAEGIFAREVKTSDIAFHSKYVEPASVIMRKELKKVIPNPLKRSSLWISSSVPEKQWQTEKALYASADYSVNNFLSPVLFKEAMSHVPKNALVIEIAPHALFGSIVKNNKKVDHAHVGLMNKNVENNLEHFLQAVGKLYTLGLNPAARHLYPPISFPVPRGTPMLNSMIIWDHSNKLKTWTMNQAIEAKDSVCLDTNKGGPFEFLLDHVVDGTVLFPATGYLWLAWRAFARTQLAQIDECPVVIEDFRAHRASALPKNGIFRYNVKILENCGNFSILEGDSLLVTGIIRKDCEVEVQTDHSNLPAPVHGIKEDARDEVLTLDAKSLYKEFKLRGYEYGLHFQGLTQMQSNGLRGQAKWEGNWLKFLDSVVQVGILHHPSRNLMLPTRIRKLRIDPTRKPGQIGEELVVISCPWINRVTCGPVELHDVLWLLAPRKPIRQTNLVLEEFSFTPYFDCNALSEEQEDKVKEYTHVCSTLAYQALKGKLKGSELVFDTNHFSLAPDELIQKYLNQEEYVISKIFKRMISEPTSVETIQNSIEEYAVHENKKTPNSCMEEKCQDGKCKPLDIGNDFLCNLSKSEGALADVLNIAFDNFEDYKFGILEISHRDNLHDEIKEIFKLSSRGFIYPKYRMLKPGTSNETKETREQIEVISGVNELSNLRNKIDLLVAKDIFTDSALSLNQHLHTLVSVIKENGFFLLIERTAITPAEKALSELFSQRKALIHTESVLEEAFVKEGLTIVAKRKDKSTFVTYLFRKTVHDCIGPRLFVLEDKDNNYAWVEDLKAAIKENEECEEKRNIWIISMNPKSGVVGLFNSLRTEEGGTRLRYYFDEGFQDFSEEPSFILKGAFIKDLISKDLRSNVYRNSQYGYFSSRKVSKELSRELKGNSYLTATKQGDLSSLRWIESSHKFWSPSTTSNKEDVKVQVFYSALNFRDVMVASGKLRFSNLEDALSDEDCRIGFEFSGVEESSGRRVMGIVPCRGLANTVVCSKGLLFDVPSKWTLEEASTVPLVYLTAYYALLIRGRLRAGESVLIHAGSGGVGQAAISICLSMGCQVFTTVGSQEKRDYLLNLFPDLDPQMIFNSRSLNFEEDILNNTRGKGVDMVLNSLAEEKLQASLRCLKTYGKFLEIGMYDVTMDHALGMSHFAKNIEFHGIFLTTLMEKQFRNHLESLASTMMEGIRKGCVRPLKTNVFPREKAEEAFRFLANGKHIGKVVLKIRDEDEPDATGLKGIGDQDILSIPRTYFDPNKSVVITGGLGGIGFELCRWLIDRGARHLVLSSRTGVKTDYQRMWIEKWSARGIQVKICNQNIMDPEECRSLLKEASQMAPVGAIFHLALVLHSGIFQNLTPENYRSVCGPKVEGIKNLDASSRELCPRLDYFCAFSSILASRGLQGLSNYAYANSAMERIIELRRADNLPGQAIEYGPFGKVGVFHDEYGDNFMGTDYLKGAAHQSLTSCLEILDKSLQENFPVLVSYVFREEFWSTTRQAENLVQLLCKIIGIPNPSSLNPDTKLGNLGIDSLMIVETKQILEVEYDTSLTIPEILKLTIQQLEDISANAMQKNALKV